MREIGRGSSLFLLYGEAGVGKSSFLRQLKATRFQNQLVHFLNFEDQPAEKLAETIRNIAESANEGDVLIFDHFEVASNKAQHQIFESWSTDGRDSKLNLIVCASSTSFNGFRQLAQQFQIEAKSFQLMPCEEAECEAFIRFRLYPEQPFDNLVIPVTVRRLIRQSGGLISRLKEIIEREGETITLEKDRLPLSRVAPTVIIFLLTLLIGGAGILYFLNKPQVPIENPVAVPAPQPEPETIARVIKVEPAIETDLQTESQAEPVIEGDSQSSRQPGLGSDQLQEPISELEQKIEAEAEPNSNGLQIRLQDSLEWIQNSDSNRGTIQIMSVGFDRFDEKAFQTYLNDLANRGIDISQVRIFRSKAAEQEIYSLIYGDFASRKEAGKQISNLPDVLGVNGPIPRSVGSIASNTARYSTD